MPATVPQTKTVGGEAQNPTARGDAAGAADKVNVKRTQIEKAARALVQLVAKRTANANPLFESNAETITLLFNVSYIPDKRKIKPVLIPLPHSLYDDKSEVCFISKDPQKEYKELLLKKHPVPGLTKVLGIDKLRRNYKTADSKRALADSFDLFLCDMRVVEMMPKLLGTVFYTKKKKRPIPVRMRGDDPTPALKKAIGGATLRIPAGPTLGVKFGRCGMPENQLVDNAVAVIAHVASHLRRNPVQSISMQATDAPALPIWRRPRPPGELVDLKKYHSDAMSSAASDTGVSGADLTEETADLSELRSDAGETLSTRDTVTELDSADEPLSELDTAGESELDLQAGDVDEAQRAVSRKERMPLVQGLRAKRRLGSADTTKETLVAETTLPAATADMRPPPKKSKKAKAKPTA